MKFFSGKPTFQLTRDEASDLDKIDFDSTIQAGRLDSLRRSCAAAEPLTLSLLERDAIPDVRLRYFTDPELNINSAKSRKEVFESNGAKGNAILRDGNFLKHLRYFLFGPNLPAGTLQKFGEHVQDDDELDTMRAFARAETRRLGLDGRDTSEEFFKLALECGLEDYEARSIRDNVRPIRRR